MRTSFFQNKGGAGLVLLLGLAIGCSSHELDGQNTGPDGSGGDGTSIDNDNDGYVDGVDCDDNDVNVHPGAEEICDGIDNDCDGTTDQDATDGIIYYADTDEDTYGDGDTGVVACSQPDGYVADDSDCDDLLNHVNPGGVESCDADNIDEDCDGAADDLDEDGAEGKTTYYTDGDGDDFGDSAVDGVDYCDPPEGVVVNNSDCDDVLSGVNPNAVEICDPDNIDEDCDGAADDLDEGGAEGKTTYYTDGDGDDFGDVAAEGMDYCDPPEGVVSDNSDCDDVLPGVNPNAAEVCDPDNIDEDCDGAADDLDAEGADGKATYYKDEDLDSYGDSDDLGSDYCDPPAGMSENNTDCNDVFPHVYPGAVEVCDVFGIDEDCDGAADDLDVEGAEGKTTYYVDNDIDSFGDQNDPGVEACLPPEGLVANNTDCNDALGNINPAAVEVCDPDETDENCNGVADDNDEGTVAGTTTYYTDADGDSFGDAQSVGVELCEGGVGFSVDNTDCDDSNENVYPDAIDYTPESGGYSTTYAELHYDECGFFGANLSSVIVENNTNGTFTLTEGGIPRSCCFVAGANPAATDFVCEVVETVEIGAATNLTTEQHRWGYWLITDSNTLYFVKNDVASCEGTGCDTIYPTAVPSCEGQSAYHLSRN